MRIQRMKDDRTSTIIREHTCHAIRSRFKVRRRVLAPIRAAASAASHPACPPPTTTTSYTSSSFPAYNRSWIPATNYKEKVIYNLNYLPKKCMVDLFKRSERMIQEVMMFPILKHGLFYNYLHYTKSKWRFWSETKDLLSIFGTLPVIWYTRSIFYSCGKGFWNLISNFIYKEYPLFIWQGLY